MKGTERHHLKEDGFIHGMHWFLEFFRKWRREVVSGALIVLALGVLFGIFQFARARQARIQSGVLGEILTLRAGLSTTPADVSKLEALTGKGKFGRVASINLATWWIEQGRLDKAQAALPAAESAPRDFYYYQARELAAQIALLKGDAEGAIAILKKIVEENPKDYILDAVFFRQAEALEKKGDTAEALALYKKIQTEYAQSYFGYDASQKVRKLESVK